MTNENVDTIISFCDRLSQKGYKFDIEYFQPDELRGPLTVASCERFGYLITASAWPDDILFDVIDTSTMKTNLEPDGHKLVTLPDLERFLADRLPNIARS